MRSFVIFDSHLSYRVQAPTAETAVRSWASAVLGGTVAVGQVGYDQFVAMQMAPAGRGASALVSVRPEAAPAIQRSRRTMRAPRAAMAHAA